MSKQPFEKNVPLRRKDFDASGHMYHGEYLTVTDEGRRALIVGQIISAPHSNYIVARIEIDFLKMIMLKTAEATVRIEVDQNLGNSSFVLIESVFANGGELCARSRTTTVLWDLKANASRRINDEERLKLAGYFAAAA